MHYLTLSHLSVVMARALLLKELSEVWLGTWDHKPVVFKRVFGEREAAIERKAYKMVNRARSQYCFQPLASGWDNDAFTFVLPRGVPLLEIPEIRSLRVICHVFLQLCKALRELHKIAITHCDIKLSNLVATETGCGGGDYPSRWKVFLIDFGVAALSRSEDIDGRGTFGMSAIRKLPLITCCRWQRAHWLAK